MITVFDDQGRRIPPAAAQRQPVGRKLNQLAARYGVRHIVPFSSMHRHQRTDSLWADEYSTRLADCGVGFDARGCELLPAFVRYDALLDHVQPIAPEKKVVPQPPEAFGDRWHEPLEADEVERAKACFQRIVSLGKVLDFVELAVGGRRHVVTYGRGPYKRGITFEAPRQSLLTAVQYEVFDAPRRARRAERARRLRAAGREVRGQRARAVGRRSRRTSRRTGRGIRSGSCGRRWSVGTCGSTTGRRRRSRGGRGGSRGCSR